MGIQKNVQPGKQNIYTPLKLSTNYAGGIQREPSRIRTVTVKNLCFDFRKVHNELGNVKKF